MGIRNWRLGLWGWLPRDTKVWDLLDSHKRGEIPAGEFVRAAILSAQDVSNILQKAGFARFRDLFTVVPLEAYRQFFVPVLRLVYSLPPESRPALDLRQIRSSSSQERNRSHGSTQDNPPSARSGRAEEPHHGECATERR